MKWEKYGKIVKQDKNESVIFMKKYKNALCVILAMVCLLAENISYAYQGGRQIDHYLKVCNYVDLYEGVFEDSHFENLNYSVTRRDVLCLLINIKGTDTVEDVKGYDAQMFKSGVC